MVIEGGALLGGGRRCLGANLGRCLGDGGGVVRAAAGHLQALGHRLQSGAHGCRHDRLHPLRATTSHYCKKTLYVAHAKQYRSIAAAAHIFKWIGY